MMRGVLHYRPLAGLLLRRLLRAADGRPLNVGDVLGAQIEVMCLPGRELRRLRSALVGLLAPADMAVLRWLLRPEDVAWVDAPPACAGALVAEARQLAVLIGWVRNGSPMPRAAVRMVLRDLGHLAPAERAAAAHSLEQLTDWPADEILAACQARMGPGAAASPAGPADERWERFKPEG